MLLLLLLLLRPPDIGQGNVFAVVGSRNQRSCSAVDAMESRGFRVR